MNKLPRMYITRTFFLWTFDTFTKWTPSLDSDGNRFTRPLNFQKTETASLVILQLFVNDWMWIEEPVFCSTSHVHYFMSAIAYKIKKKQYTCKQDIGHKQSEHKIYHEMFKYWL